MIQLLDRMECIIQLSVADGQFMGSALVYKNGNVLLDKGYGYANVEWQIPNSCDTKFRLGSITKQFTAAAILLLEERSNLKLDDLLSKYMSVPTAWNEITIFHLLTHTSGIPNYTAFPDFNDFAATTKSVTPKQMIDLFINIPLHFKPGTKYDYCNSGYVILGYLIEQIFGKSYQDFVDENIFKKHGMNDSGYDSNTQIIPHRASGYENTPDGMKNAEYLNCCIPYSAGSLYSTTHDLLQWQQKLFGGEVLSAQSLQKMITPFKDNYGLGVFIKEIDSHLLIGHGGGINGFQTNMVYSPSEDLLVIVLSNLIAIGFPPQNIALKLAKLSRGEDVLIPSERKEITVPLQLIEKYVGVYELSSSKKIALTVEDGHLIALVTYQPKVQLLPESDTKYFSRIPDMQVEFMLNPNGECDNLTLILDGEKLEGCRSIVTNA